MSGSADGPSVTRRYDAADRLVQSTDANGNWASYEYDVAGRVVRQTLTDPRAPMGQRQSVTTWTYTGTLLTGIDHPGQQERYIHDVAGRVTTKTVTLSPAGGKAITSLTEYAYDRSGDCPAFPFLTAACSNTGAMPRPGRRARAPPHPYVLAAVSLSLRAVVALALPYQRRRH